MGIECHRRGLHHSGKLETKEKTWGLLSKRDELRIERATLGKCEEQLKGMRKGEKIITGKPGKWGASRRQVATD